MSTIHSKLNCSCAKPTAIAGVVNVPNELCVRQKLYQTSRAAEHPRRGRTDRHGEGPGREIDLGSYFGGEGSRYHVSADPGGVVHGWESAGRLTLTPLAAGVATVGVTATNSAGSAEQRFVVEVAAAAPAPLGGIEGVTLAAGGEAREFALADYFSGVVARYRVSADPVGIAHAWLSEGRLRLTPLSRGAAGVTVTAVNGGGSARQEFTVVVQ